MPRKEFQIHVEGIPWTVRYTAKRPRLDGRECDGTMSPREQVIRIYGGRDKDDDFRLRTLLHEWCHVRFPDYDEDAILGLEQDLFEAVSTQRDMEGD